jgi:hypothetical protein
MALAASHDLVITLLAPDLNLMLTAGGNKCET